MSLSVASCFLCGTHYPSSLQDNTIYNGQIFSEGPIGLNFTWHFSDGSHPSFGNGMLEEHRFIIFLYGNPQFIQAVTFGTYLLLFLFGVHVIWLA